MTLDDARTIVIRHYGESVDRAFLDLAIQEAHRNAIAEAAMHGSLRLIRETAMDLIKDKVDYQLRPEIYSVIGVERRDITPPTRLTPISFPQSGQVREGAFNVPGHGGGFNSYWVTHRTLHLDCASSATAKDALIIFAYVVPKLPSGEHNDTELPIPDEMILYVLARAALLVSPPPAGNLLNALGTQMQMLHRTYNDWLLDAVKDLPPSLLHSGSDGMW